MRSDSKAKSLKKKIANFRLTAAAEVLRNPAYTAIRTNDIHSSNHIGELCDQYSLLIILNWLSTKYGFPICTLSMPLDKGVEGLPLLSWASLVNRYPMQVHDAPHVISEICQSLVSMMEQSFPVQVEVVGELYQQILSAPLAIAEDNTPYIDLRSDQRNGGEFYTPAWVADCALEQWFETDADRFLRRIKTNDQSLIPKILDPSCGSGNFLLAAIRLAEKRDLRPESIRKFAETSIHGRDIDGRAIELAKFSVLISLSKCFQVLSPSQRAVAIEALCERLDQNFKCTDSLLMSCASDDRNQFDLVVTNPPYISFGSRDQQSISLNWQQHLKRRFPASSEYKIRYTSIFQEIGFDLGSSEGQFIYLVPDAFLTGSYYQKLRKLILDKVDIVAFTELPESTIGDATVGRWCLAHYRQKNPDAVVSLIKLKSINLKAVSFAKSELNSESNSRFGSRSNSEFDISLAELVSRDRNRFQLIFSEEDLRILSLCRDLPWLGETLKGHTGIRSRNGQAAIVSNSQVSDDYHKGIKSGGEVKPYQVQWNGHWIEVVAKNLFAGGFDPEVISSPKVLLRQTGDRLIAAADFSGLYHLNNVHSFVPLGSEARSELIHYYVSLLNSSFYLYFYRMKTREHKRALAQIDIETVEHMPHPPRNAKIELELQELAKRLSNQMQCQTLVEVSNQDSHQILNPVLSHSSNKMTKKSLSQAHKPALIQAWSEVGVLNPALPCAPTPEERAEILTEIDKLVFLLFGIDQSMQRHIIATLARS